MKTTCCYCGVGCGVVIHKDRQGKLRIEGDKEHPVNRGMLCSKGMNLHYTVMDTTDRLLYPEMRYNRNLPRQRVSWDAAFQRAAAAFKAIIDKYGADSVGFYASGQCLTEEYYVINKLIKGFIGSNNIDTNSRLCMSSAVVGYKMSLGEDSVPVCYDDIELSDCLLVAGANPAWCHPILWRRIEAHKAANPHVKIIVTDPRQTQSCSIADLHLQLTAGTDVVLHHAIGRALIEQGDIDVDFIKNHAEGFEKYKDNVFKRTLAEAAQICGIEESDIRLAASYIGNAKGFLTLWTMGLNQSVIGVNKNLSLINLNLITGHIGKAGSGPFSLTGQPNAMGGREVGGLANLLPAHRNLADPQHRAEVQQFWGGTQISDKVGLTATEMFDALNEGKLKAIWIICTNPLVSLPDVRAAEEGLKKAKLVIVQDISNKPETLQYADIVLPAAGWAEKEGTMTNAERRISYLPKINEPLGEALPDAEIICRFAKAMGFKGFDFKNAEEIYKEHAQLTKGTTIDVSELNYSILKRKLTVQWPYLPEENDRGTPRLFTDKVFHTPSKKAVIHTVSDENESEKPTPEFPLILTTGRVRDQWHTMSKTGKVNKLNQHTSESFLEIHPQNAKERNLKTNDVAVVNTPRGQVRVKVNITENIKKGMVFLPMHWGKILNNDLNRANNLTNKLLDPKSKEPDFKFCAVQVKKYHKPKQKIIIIGAGAAAFGFVKSYREQNQTDEIEVFSKEIFPFYNRVMLPDYISGHQSWEQLVKMKIEEFEAHNIKVNCGVGIEQINTSQKTVLDSAGNWHTYDLLILATGSRANLPKEVPKMKGIFTMRARQDADNLRNHLAPNAQVVIAGGGLLGLELADSLRVIGMKVTVVNRISRLMDRQLDLLGGQLLEDELIERGIEIFANDEIQSFNGNGKITGVKLKSGQILPCAALVFAIGTIPNIEFIKEAGIACKRGVLVNEYLQTSDPHVFAMGEIAEFKGEIYGITAAAEQQASILANYLRGDIAAYYKGSLSMNILKMDGLQLCSLGMINTPENADYEEVVFIDKAKCYYKKCIIHKDRLVGAILIGDKSEFLEFKDLISNKIELSEKRLELLRSGKKAEPIIGRLVCACNSVGEGNLVNKIKEGCTDFQQLCQSSGAGTGCGSCRSEVSAILDKNREIVSSELIINGLKVYH